MKNKQNQHGNVLWFIMIAVIFVGLITMVMTRNASTVSQTGDLEQVQIKIGQVLRYAKSVEAAVEEMRLRGVSESDISFQNDVTTADYTNPGCTSNDCRIFHPEGAGLTYRHPTTGANDGSEWIFTGAMNVGTTDDPIGTTAARTGNDLIMMFANANPVFCSELNRQLEVDLTGVIPIDDGGTNPDPFVGVYDNALALIDGSPSPFELNGRAAGCYTDEAAAPDVTYFYYVLIAR